HQQSAVASSHDRQAGRIGVLGLDQIFRAGDEVIENILLAREIAGLVPLLAVLSASAQIGDHVNPTVIKPDPSQRSQEVRAHADVVSAITFQQYGISAVEPGSLFANDVQGYARAVLGGRKLAYDLGILEADRRRAHHRRAYDFGAPGIHAVPARWIQPG